MLRDRRISQTNLYFREGRIAGGWQERHERGEVPGAWPYGLEGLADRLSASLAYVPPVSRKRLYTQRALGLVSRRSRERTISWDEMIGHDVAVMRKPAQLFSGVIWLTDQASRGMDVSAKVKALRRADALWVLSRAQIEPLKALLGDGAPRVEFLKFGIDAEFFGLRPWPERARIVSAGGDRDRDIKALFEALDLVHKARPDVELTVQTKVDVPAPDGVSTIPHLPHLKLRDFYASATAVAIATQPNIHVSGMTVSLEAMATGRPVVITESPGMDDYIQDGAGGVVVPHGDVEAMADALVALVDDEDAARKLGLAGRRHVEERHTSAQMVADLAQLIES